MPTVYLALLIPIIVTGIFYIIVKHEFVWWEFFIPIASVLIAIVISKAAIDHSSVQFTEYWGSTIISVYEEEPHNYWQHQTCYRSEPCGTDSDGHTQYCSIPYDCSHQVDVSPSWWAVTNINEKIDITERDHDNIVKQFKTTKTKIDSRKNYAPRDGAVGSKGTKFEGKRVGEISYTYQTTWDGNDDTRKPYVSQHNYENRIKASDLTIFNISLVKEEEADSLGLFKYPPYEGGGWFSYTKGLEYPTILGNVSNEIQEKFKRLNGKYGSTNQLRLWILVFENKPISIAQYQENYWVKGNKNELVICIGKRGNEILWSHAFSWATSDVLTVDVKNEVMNLYTYKDSVIKKQLPPVIPLTNKTKKIILGKAGEKLPNVLPLPKQIISDTTIKIKSTYPVLTNETWNNYYNYLNNNLNKFQRRSFKEFDYLTVEPSTGAVIFIYLLALGIAIAVNFWVINNDIYE